MKRTILTLLFSILSLFGWWNSAWRARGMVKIVNNSGSIIREATVSVIIAKRERMKDDFSDIRFVLRDDETVLPYWIEWYDSDTAYIWFKTPQIITGEDFVWVYYDNPSATYIGNGEEVFLFFDDFSIEDISKFTYRQPYAGYSPAGCEVFDGYLKITRGNSTWNILHMKRSFSENDSICVSMRISVEACKVDWLMSFLVSEDNIDMQRFGIMDVQYEKCWMGMEYVIDGEYTYNEPLLHIRGIYPYEWYKIDNIKMGNGHFKMVAYDDHRYVIDSVRHYSSLWEGRSWTWVTWKAGSPWGYYDYIFVRKVSPDVGVSVTYPSHDMAVTEIVSPADTTIVDDSLTLSCVVKNEGTFTENPKIIASIMNKDSSLLFLDTTEVVIAPSEEMTVDFIYYGYTEPDRQYIVKFNILDAQDQYLENNYLARVFYLMPRVDMKGYNILSPEDMGYVYPWDTTITPSAIFLNNGVESIMNISAALLITEHDGGELLYKDSLLVPCLFEPHTTFTVLFTPLRFSFIYGDKKINLYFIALLDNDQARHNDTLTRTIRVSGRGITEDNLHVSPAISWHFPYLKWVIPQSIPEAELIVCDISGRVIVKQVIRRDKKGKIYLGDVANGVFFVVFKYQDKTIHRKLVIMK